MSPIASALAGVALIAASTLAGAWLARRASRLPAVTLAGAAVALAAVVLADLVPDVWHDLPASEPGRWAAVGMAAAGCAVGYAVAEVLARRGCACQARSGAGRGWAATAASPGGGTATASGRETATASGGAWATASGGAWATASGGGGAAAVALAAHRLLEGAAVALTGSAAVIVALAVHAAGEGFALAGLLRGERRSSVVPLLVFACLSPAAGAVALGQIRLPDRASAVLTAVVAGAMSRAAVDAWRLARAGRRRDHRESGARALADGGARGRACAGAGAGIGTGAHSGYGANSAPHEAVVASLIARLSVFRPEQSDGVADTLCPVLVGRGRRDGRARDGALGSERWRGPRGVHHRRARAPGKLAIRAEQSHELTGGD